MPNLFIHYISGMFKVICIHKLPRFYNYKIDRVIDSYFKFGKKSISFKIKTIVTWSIYDLNL